MRNVALLLALATLTTLGCDTPNADPQDTGGTETGGETGMDSSGGETGGTEAGGETGGLESCDVPLPAAEIDHEIEFSGFPEIDGDMIVDLDSNGFEYQGNCTVASVGSVPPLNAIVLACEHPQSENAEVTLTLDGVDFPTGLDGPEVVQLTVSSAVEVGGLADELDIESSGPKPRLLMAGYQSYEIRDSDGLVFAAMHGLSDFSADYGEVTLELADACPSYQFGDPDIAAYFHAATSEASVDVAVGETKSVALGEFAWDVRTFRAQRSCCHGDLADVRVIRTAP